MEKTGICSRSLATKAVSMNFSTFWIDSSYLAPRGRNADGPQDGFAREREEGRFKATYSKEGPSPSLNAPGRPLGGRRNGRSRLSGG